MLAPMKLSVEKALEHWQREGLLTSQKAQELRTSLGRADAEIPHHAIRIFSAIGALLIGLGVILFVASNWQEIPPVAKVALLLVGMLCTAFPGYHLAFERKTYERTGHALLFVSQFLFGGSIFLIGQIYHLPLLFWWGMLLWFLGTAFLAYIFASRTLLTLSVPQFLLFLGWLRASILTGFGDELDILFDPRISLLSLLPLVGAAMLGEGLLARRRASISFCGGTLLSFGLVLIALPLVVTTADREVFFTLLRLPTDTVALIILVVSVIVALSALVFGTYDTREGRGGYAALLAYLLCLFLLTRVPEWIGFPVSLRAHDFAGFGDAPMLTGLFVLHILLVVVFLLTLVWYGALLRAAMLINLGIVGIVVTVMIQYFSWVFVLFDRSLAFIIGGLLLLSLSAALERKRRALLASLT